MNFPELKNREDQGYEYSAAEASYELLVNRVLGRARTYFRLISFRILDSVFTEGVAPFTEATVMLRVGGVIEHTAATGKGPVNAMDCALRKGLERFYPNLKEMRLMDFKVRVLAGVVRDDGNSGTASEVRVLIESGDQKSRWTTVGVSYNIIEASRQALEDSINYKLFKDGLMWSPFTVFHIGYDGRNVFPSSVLKETFQDKATVMGSVDTKLMIDPNPNKVYNQAKEQLLAGRDAKKGYILGTACETPPYTIPGQLLALVKAARDFGTYGTW